MNASRPYFSIIIPSFNQGRYLGQAIRSVVSQSETNWELFILDGGSTDSSLKIIKRFSQEYPRKILWRSHKDKGQVAAINEGLKQAKGEVVAYLNSDDFYMAGAFKNVKRFFEKNCDKDWLVGNCRCSDKTLDYTFRLKETIPYYRWPKLLFIGNFINQPAVFLKHKLVSKVGAFSEKYHYAFDYDYWLRCLKYSNTGRLNIDLAGFRIHPQSKGNTGFVHQFDEDYQVANKHCRNVWLTLPHWVLNLGIKTVYTFLK